MIASGINGSASGTTKIARTTRPGISSGNRAMVMMPPPTRKALARPRALSVGGLLVSVGMATSCSRFVCHQA
jgi:hypothetical protein